MLTQLWGVSMPGGESDRENAMKVWHEWSLMSFLADGVSGVVRMIQSICLPSVARFSLSLASDDRDFCSSE
jgi:hypothetical protein